MSIVDGEYRDIVRKGVVVGKINANGAVRRDFDGTICRPTSIKKRKGMYVSMRSKCGYHSSAAVEVLLRDIWGVKIKDSETFFEKLTKELDPFIEKTAYELAAENREKVSRHLEEHPDCGPTELSEKLGVTINFAAKQRMKFFAEKGEWEDRKRKKITEQFQSDTMLKGPYKAVVIDSEFAGEINANGVVRNRSTKEVYRVSESGKSVFVQMYGFERKANLSKLLNRYWPDARLNLTKSWAKFICKLAAQSSKKNIVACLRCGVGISYENDLCESCKEELNTNEPMITKTSFAKPEPRFTGILAGFTTLNAREQCREIARTMR